MPELVQTVGKGALRRAQSIWNTKQRRERKLTELLSDASAERIREHFKDELALSNQKLMPAYDQAASYLLEDLVVVENGQGYSVVPRRIMAPSEQDLKYIEFYLSLAALDKSLSAYKGVEASKSSERKELQRKIGLAEGKRKEADVEWKRINGRKASAPVEKAAKDSEMKRLEEVSKKQQGLLDRYNRSLARLDREVQEHLAQNPLRAYHDAALSIAKELGLEQLLDLSLPREEAHNLTFNPETLKQRIEGYQVRFDVRRTYYTSKVPGLSGLKGCGVLLLFAGIAIYAIIGPYEIGKKLRGWWDRKNVEAPEEPVPKEPKPVVPKRYPPRPRARPRLEHKPKHAPKEIPYKPETVWIRSKMYMAGQIKISSFDPENLELHLQYGSFPVKYKLNIKPEQLHDTYPDILLVSYRLENDELFEVGTFYSLLPDGRWGEIVKGIENPIERRVPKEEIDDYAREMAQAYELAPLSDAGIIVKGKKVLDGRYESRKGELIFTTTQHGFDLRAHPGHLVLSDTSHDRIPDLFVTFDALNRHYLDIDFAGRAMLIKPPEGRKIEVVKLRGYSPSACRINK